MTYEAVVFDLDGTLSDSAPGILTSVRYALEKMHLPILPDATLRKFLGPPLADSFIRFCGLTREEAIEATLLYRERYHAIGWLENQIYPGVRSLLLTLKLAGVRLSIATGKPQDASEMILDHFRLSHLFSSIVGPLPAEYHVSKGALICRSLEGCHGRAVMIGDRDLDILGAQEAGIDSIGVTYGYGTRQELESAHSNAVISNLNELYGVLGVSAEKHKGYFITFEGNDGCGKSTQVRMLAELLRSFGYDVVQTREPGGSDIAERIRNILLDPQNSGISDMTEAYLYAAARAQHVREVILPALAGGRIVISDRYVDSSIAYQGAGRELGTELVERLNKPAIDGCLPSLTILLDIDAKTAMLRRQSATGVDRIEMQSEAFHKRVEQAFHHLASENSMRYEVINADSDRETISKKVAETVFTRLQGAGLL